MDGRRVDLVAGAPIAHERAFGQRALDAERDDLARAVDGLVGSDAERQVGLAADADGHLLLIAVGRLLAFGGALAAAARCGEQREGYDE